MTIARENYTEPEPILAPGLKNFLEGFLLGRAGISLGRKSRQSSQRLRDPIQHKEWIRQFGLPLRNAIVLNRPVKATFENLEISLVPRGAAAGNIWAGLSGERQELLFVLDILQPGMIFFDVGANAGPFALTAANKAGATGVFAFEPCSLTCELLRKNVALNGLTDVTVVQKALGSVISEGVLHLNARGRDDLNTLGQPIHPLCRVVGQEKVHITTVDTFMKEQNISHVDLMKVDIQGAELLLFRGARKLLQRPDAPLIVYEDRGFLTRGFGYHPVEILWFLESCGYSLFMLSGENEISELNANYKHDSTVLAAKPGNSGFASGARE